MTPGGSRAREGTSIKVQMFRGSPRYSFAGAMCEVSFRAPPGLEAPRGLVGLHLCDPDIPYQHVDETHGLDLLRICTSDSGEVRQPIRQPDGSRGIIYTMWYHVVSAHLRSVCDGHEHRLRKDYHGRNGISLVARAEGR